MAILTAGTIRFGMNYVSQAKVGTTKSILQTTQTAIDSYYLNTNQYPNTLTDLMRQPSDPKIGKKWQGPYWPKKEEPKDAYGNNLL